MNQPPPHPLMVSRRSRKSAGGAGYRRGRSDQELLIGDGGRKPRGTRTAPEEAPSNGHQSFGRWPMLRQAICSAIVFGALVTGSGAALAENRLALVIGESAYRS